MFTAKNTLVFKYHLLKATAQIHIHIFTCLSAFGIFLFLCCFQLQVLRLLNVCTLSNQNVKLVCTGIMPSNFLIFFMLLATLRNSPKEKKIHYFYINFLSTENCDLYTETKEHLPKCCMSDRIKYFKQSKQIWLFFLFKV